MPRAQPGATDRIRLEEKFLAGGRSSLDGPDASKRVLRHKKEITSLKRIIGGYAVANGVLKKRWRTSKDECRACDTGNGGPQQGVPALLGVGEGMALHAQTQKRVAGPPSAGGSKRSAPQDLPAARGAWPPRYSGN